MQSWQQQGPLRAWAPDSERRFRLSCFGFRVSCFGFQVSGFDFQVSGFRFRFLEGFGVRVSNFGQGHTRPERFRGGLVFKAHRLLYHSTLGSRVMKKKKKKTHQTRASDEDCEAGAARHLARLVSHQPCLSCALNERLLH